ncbi:MAG: bifunctional 3'-5' exonuclease/DNA polymerase, partial [Candidatus Fermentibacteria bacterium]|nr:bifunctional 3'-5' exonuclease/DNA polymerase [Candidatus Fermentibacteria bacterium]
MGNWQLIDTVDQVEAVSAELLSAEIMAVDTETTGLDPHASKLRLIQIAVEGNSTVIFDCFKLLPEAAEKISAILTSHSIKIFQNAKFDLKFLRSGSISVSGWIFDTMLAARLLRTSGGPRSAGLASLAQHYLGQFLSKEEQKSDFSSQLSTKQLDYAAKDAEILLELRHQLLDEIKKHHLIEAARLEFACVYAVASMEYDGIYLDRKKWSALRLETEQAMSDALAELYPFIGYPAVQLDLFGHHKSYGHNANSTRQVLKMLNDNGIDVENTSKHSLAHYSQHPIVVSLLKYRTASKALSSFLHSIPGQINRFTGRLHPHYSQIGAWSGRMSCGGPNIQQIPRGKAFRQCFAAPPGRKLIIADYSQIELRVIAQISGDPRMIEAYRNGEDLHKLTAALVLQKQIGIITKKERQAAKAVNFGLVFGMGAAGLKAYAMETYGVEMSMDEAEVFKKRFFAGYRGLDSWHKELQKKKPGTSRTLAGRKHTYSIESGMSIRYNTPVQGTAADILKNALGMLYVALKGTDTFIVAVIHDEIVLECDESIAEETALLLKNTMEASATAGTSFMYLAPASSIVFFNN